MRVGVTGSYASGKGTICHMFEKLGAITIDTDMIARQVVKPGSEGLNEIISEFGQQYLNEDQTLNRRKFAQDIFKSKKLVKKLNGITHPLILKETLKLSPESHSQIYMINTPLLFESAFDKYMDATITIFTDKKNSISRGIDRDGLTEKEIKARLKNQFSINKKIKLADYVIDNNFSLENTEKKVKEIWKILTMELNNSNQQ